VAGTRDVMLRALCDELGVGKGSDVARMIIVVVRTDEEINIRGPHPNRCQLFDHVHPVVYDDTTP